MKSMKDISRKDSDMEKELTISPMVTLTKETGLMTKKMGMECIIINLKMPFMMVSGKTM